MTGVAHLMRLDPHNIPMQIQSVIFYICGLAGKWIGAINCTILSTRVYNNRRGVLLYTLAVDMPV